MKVLAGILLAMASAQAIGCPANADLTVRNLLGPWRAQFEGARPTGTLLLEPNPDWPGSFAGRLSPAEGRPVRVAGDLEDGVFTLEESADGVRIDATWIGQPVEGSCGREIRGQWQASGPAGATGASQGFVLRRVSGW